jgi:hypothetical protein
MQRRTGSTVVVAQKREDVIMSVRNFTHARIARFETLEQKQPLAADLLGLGSVSSLVHNVADTANGTIDTAQNVVNTVLTKVDAAATKLLGFAPLSTVQNLANNVLSGLSSLNVGNTLSQLTSGLLNNGLAAQTSLVATLSGVGGATGSATLAFNAAGLNSSATFDVTIQNALANSILPVTVNGMIVGNIQVDALGKGELLLASNAAESGHLLPLTFPTITANSTIQVGSLLSGSFNAAVSSSGANVGLNVSTLLPNAVDNVFALI